MNLCDRIIQKTQEQPEKVAMVYFGFPVTFGRLGDMIDKYSSGLHSLGIGPGDIVFVL